ncbi:MAG TPA: hypothetical protein VF516_44240, partial [Kofleriaceae bacterium]
MSAVEVWQPRADAWRRVHEARTSPRQAVGPSEISLEFSGDGARCRKLMETAAEIYRGPVVSPVAGSEVELIGDEELGDDDASAVDNPRSRVDPAARRALRELLGDGV